MVVVVFVQLGFFIDRAGADKQSASRASVSVLFLKGLSKVDLGDIRDGGKPGKYVGKLFFEVFPIVP